MYIRCTNVKCEIVVWVSFYEYYKYIYIYTHTESNVICFVTIRSLSVNLGLNEYILRHWETSNKHSLVSVLHPYVTFVLHYFCNQYFITSPGTIPPGMDLD